MASGFQPVLTSTQPNPAQPPLSEFFLQLSPDHHILLQLKDGLIAPLRDFNPVRTNTSQSETEPLISLQFLFIKFYWLQKFYWLLFTQSLKPNVLHISVISGCFCHIWREDSCCCDVPKEWYCESHLKKQDKNVFLGMYLYLNQLLFLLKACSINLFSADTGRRHLDTTIIYHMDPNGGKPNRVRADAEIFKFNRLLANHFDVG